MIRQFTWAGFGIRLLFALVIVLATYNPEGYSYFHWGLRDFMPISPLKLVVGIILLIGWIIFIRATMRSLGGLGLILAAGLCAAVVWLLIDWGVIPKDGVKVISYAVLFIISIILAVGMSWSHIRRRMSGQLDVDDVDENT